MIISLGIHFCGNLRRQVFQLETAMGSAIESFDDSGAVVVPRSRFAPVKTTNDLFVLRSDAYNVRSSRPSVEIVPLCLAECGTNRCEWRTWSLATCLSLSAWHLSSKKGCFLRVRHRKFP